MFVNSILKVGALVALLTLTVYANAQPEAGYPTRQMRMIVPFAAGSGTDGQARLIAQEISAQTGQPVIVDNKPGANGFIAAQAAAKAAPDGYTIFFTTNTTQAANPSLFKRLPYDPAKDFRPVAWIGRAPLILAVAADSPFQTLAAVTAYARANPGKVTFASGNSSSRVAGEMYAQQAKLNLLHVGYKSTPQALTDLLGGQVQIMFPDPVSALPLIRSGRIRALAVTSPSPSSSFPGIPSMAAQGLPEYSMEAWIAAYLPADTSTQIVLRLHELIRNAVKAKPFQDMARNVGLETAPFTPEELPAVERAERAKWSRIIKDAGIEPE